MSEYSKEQQFGVELHIFEQASIVGEYEVVIVIWPVPAICPAFCTYPEGQSKN